MRNRPKTGRLDLRVSRAVAFLDRAAARLPREATKALWQRVTTRLVCKRIAWKKSEADFCKAFRLITGHTLKQRMDTLWRERRERLAEIRRRERGPSLPYTFQVGPKKWFYYPRWIPADARPGDFVRLSTDGTAVLVQPPTREAV